jgi:trigger factor
MTSDTKALDSQEEVVKLNLGVKIDKPSTCERHVVVTIPRADVERYFKNAFDELKPRAELPGFRPGKAPRKLVENKFREQISDQVKSNLLMDSLQQITESGQFSAISEPSLEYEAIEIPAEGDFTYEFKIEVRPEFSTPDWHGLSLTRPTYSITDAEVDHQLSRTLQRFDMGEAVDGTAELNDMLVLNMRFLDGDRLVGFLEEEKVALRRKLSLADAVIEDFGATLTGKSEGDVVTTTFQVSDSTENEALRGKTLTAEFEIVEVRRFSVDDLNPRNLENLGFDSVEEIRAFVREELQKQLEYHQQQALREQIVNFLTKDAQWELPADLVRRQTSRELQRQALEMQRSGFPQDQIRSYLNAARRNAQESTVKALREHFILEKIAEDLKIEPTPEEYDAEIELIAEQSDASPRRIRARLEKSGQMDALRNQILERSVIQRVTEAASVTEVVKDSLMQSVPEESAVEFRVAHVAAELPEAKYDEKPEDSQKPGATVKLQQS